MKRTQLSVFGVSAVALLVSACGSSEPEPANANASPSTAAETTATTTTVRQAADPAGFDASFLDSWAVSGVPLTPAARSICDSLDKGASPEALVNDTLAWLKTNYRNGAPSKFNGWELFDAQILYLNTTDYFCPEYKGNYTP